MNSETRVEAIENGINNQVMKNEKVEEPAERLLTFDFLRGFAIFMMIILHSMNEIGNFQWALNYETLLQQPFYLIILAGVLAYFGTFAGLFLIISIAVNTFAAHKKLEKGHSPEKIFFKQLFVGFFVLLLAYLVEMVLHYQGYLGRIIFQRPDAVEIMIKRAFHFETLHTIAWCIILNGLLHYILVIKPLSKGKQPYLKATIIYAVLVIAIWISTPFVHTGVDNFMVNNFGLETFPGEHGDQFYAGQWVLPLTGGFKEFLARQFFIFIAGNLEPMFPFFATGILGAMIGMILAYKKPPKLFPLYVFLTSLGVLVSGILIAVLGNGLQYTFLRPEMDLYFLSLFGQLAGTALFLWLFEFRGIANKHVKYTRFWRRWGMVSLTIYSIQIINVVPRILVSAISGWQWNVYAHQSATTLQALITTILIVIFWDGLIRLWELIGFIGTFEWMIASLAQLTRRLPPASRLQPKRILYDIKPITYYSNQKSAENSNTNNI